MRRADRLFQLIHTMRGRRLVTARWLSQRLEVSERTVYRDIADLVASGVPLEGEAGVGYMLRCDFELPPLMFTRAEIEALVAGARMVRSWGGPALAACARQALTKIEAVLPSARRDEIERTRLFAEGAIRQALGRSLDLLHQAIRDWRVVRFDYARADGAQSARSAQPLGLFFWGSLWTLGAWCEWRKDFRSFRLDRMQNLELLDRVFSERPGVTLEDFIRTTCDETAAQSKQKTHRNE